MDANSIVVGLDAVVAVARYVLLGAAGLVGVVCAGDWLVRTRRLSPFGAPARFFRSTVNPAIAPIERAVVRAGGVPSSAPLWALVAVVVGGILLLTGLDALRGVIIGLFSAIAGGPRGILALVIAWGCGFLKLAIIVRVLSSFVRLSPYSRWVRWSFITTEWLIRPIARRIRPVHLLGMMVDLSPIIAYALIVVVEWLALYAIAI
jgi:YggT family protein